MFGWCRPVACVVRWRQLSNVTKGGVQLVLKGSRATAYDWGHTMKSRLLGEFGRAMSVPRASPWFCRLLAIVLIGIGQALAAPDNTVSEDLSPQAASELFQARISSVARALQSNPRLKRLSAQQRENLVEFVTGNMLFVLLHELAHVAIDDFELPVLGRDEDAADDYAVMRMLTVGTAFSQRVLAEAARGWFLSDRRDRKDGEPLAYYDDHGLDQQRAYNIVCLTFGSDPAKFMDLANRLKLPEDRQGTCPNDYAKVSRSWATALKPHRRALGEPKIHIDVIYGEGKGNLEPFAKGFQSIGLLDIVAQRTSDQWAWPKPFTLEMQTCGYVNAAWMATSRKLTLCYELAEDFSELYLAFGEASFAGPKRKGSESGRRIPAQRVVPIAWRRAQLARRR
jgi:hypothetical protein